MQPTHLLRGLTICITAYNKITSFWTKVYIYASSVFVHKGYVFIADIA